MALPAIVLKAKSAIKKGMAVNQASKQLKNANSTAESLGGLGFTSLPPLMKGALIIGAALTFFLFISLMSFLIYPMIVVDSLLNGGNSSSSSSSLITTSSVVSCAREQIGKEYVYGAEGPDTFDWSGLVVYCYSQALGVDLPRVTHSQEGDSHFETVTSATDLSAGDLIFTGASSATHVGIYSGNLTVTHASSTANQVTEATLDDFIKGKGHVVFRHYTG